MLRKHMASTGLAPFAVAHRGLVVGADVMRSLGHLDRRRLREAERVDGARGPVTARLAMAVPHGDRLAAHRELDGTAKAATFVFTHSASPSKAEQIDPDRQPGQGACSACAWRASIGSSLRPAIAGTFAGSDTASHPAAGRERNPGGEARAQFPASREKCD